MSSVFRRIGKALPTLPAARSNQHLARFFGATSSQATEHGHGHSHGDAAADGHGHSHGEGASDLPGHGHSHGGESNPLGGYEEISVKDWIKEGKQKAAGAEQAASKEGETKDENGEEDVEPGNFSGSGDTQSRKNAVVLANRMPKNFAEGTLLPHLEHQILFQIMSHTPDRLVKLARAYMDCVDYYQPKLTERIVYYIKYRMIGFEPNDICDVMIPMLKMQPHDYELWSMLAQRTLDRLDDFTALQLLGTIRTYLRHPTIKDFKFLKVVIPRIREMLQDYEADEISEMLVSIACVQDENARWDGEKANEIEVLAIFIPLLEQKYDDLSLVQHINNLWALTRLHVSHTPMLEQVAKDLEPTHIYEDLPTKWLCRAIWIYSRNAALEMVPFLVSEMHRHVDEISPSDFARIVQALPKDEELAKACLSHLRECPLEEYTRRDVQFILNGSAFCGLLETAPRENEDAPMGLLDDILLHFRDEQDHYNRDDIKRVKGLLSRMPKYKHLVNLLPLSWGDDERDRFDKFEERDTKHNLKKVGLITARRKWID